MTDRSDMRIDNKMSGWIKIGAIILGCSLSVALITVALYFGLKNNNPEPIHNHAMRLPRTLIPREYKLQLQTFFPLIDSELTPSMNFTFDGIVTIHLRCTKATSNITLHSKSLTIKEDRLSLVSDSNGSPVNFASPAMEADAHTEMVTFFLKSKLQPGQNYTLTIHYNGVLRDDLRGFYRTSYVTNGEKRWILVTQFEPTYARRALPCFDEPDMKAVFTVSIVHPSSTSAISNMPPERVESAENGWNITHFRPSVPMSTYLLAFAVSDLSYVETDTEDVKFRVWCREAQKNHTGFALQANPKIMEQYVQLFGKKFPLPKLDSMAVPDFGPGAMENWGLITYREALLLLDESAAVQMFQKIKVARVIAHELAHQWFGNLVTMQWWDSLWLNEGFADFVSFAGAEVALPDWKGVMEVLFVFEEIQLAMAKDELPTSSPIHRKVASSEIELFFDHITYKKGASILRMLHMVLGDCFNKGLMQYMADKEYDNASENDLWNALQNAVNNQKPPPLDWNSEVLNVTEFMDRWINLQGFPAIIISRYNHTHVQLAQKQFISDLYDASKSLETAKRQWYVPLGYRTCEGKNGLVWIQPDHNAYVKLEPGCSLVANAEVKSFVRIVYPIGESPTDLIKPEEFQSLKPGEVSQMIDDAFALARAGFVPYNVSLIVPLKLLEKQIHPIPWKTAFSGLNYLRSMFGTSDEAHALLKNLVAKIIGYSSYMWLSVKDQRQQALNEELIDSACRWQLSGCHRDAMVEFEQFVDDCNNSTAGSSSCSRISPPFRLTVYCAGVYNNSNNYDFLWKLCEKEAVNSERSRLVMAMACSQDQETLKKLLVSSLSLNSDCVRLQDIEYLYRAVGLNIRSYPIAWNFMRDNWKQFVEKDIKGALRTLVIESVRMFNSAADLQQVEGFAQTLASHHKDIFQTALDAVKVNKLWRDRYMNVIVDWIKAL